MDRAPNWTQDEFDTLLDNYRLSNEELALKLDKRRPGAVNWVRAGIHSYHRTGRNPSILSQMMVRRLEERRGSLTCHVCGAKF